jgi:hypothetical protein
MNVNFDNLRLQAAISLNKLTETLNNGILKEREFIKDKSGDVLVNSEDLQQDLDDLRTFILFIGASYNDDIDDFSDITDDILNNGGINIFNDK